MGSYCSVTNDLKNSTMLIKYGPNLGAIEIAEITSECLSIIPEVGEAFEVVSAGLAVAHDVSEAQIDAISRASISALKDKYGLGECGPGSTYTSEKMTLSLVMSAIIIVVDTVSPSTSGGANGQVIVKSGSMTVWTGSADKSTRTYNLSSFYQE